MRTTTLTILISGALLAAAPARAADAPKKTPELVEKGKAGYGKYCATCHGPKGEGNGPAAKALKPPPRNLVTTPTQGGAPAIVQVLGTGVKGTGMMAFKHIPEDDRWAIAYYVEGLAGAKK